MQSSIFKSSRFKKSRFGQLGITLFGHKCTHVCFRESEIQKSLEIVTNSENEGTVCITNPEREN